MAGALAIPVGYAPRIARAVEAAPRIPLIWLRGQSCGGDSQAFLQPTSPTIGELLVDELSLEYDLSLMAPAGTNATSWLGNVEARYPNGYIAVIEGAIPTALEGAYCTIGGRALRDIATELGANARGVITVGACAFDGGAAAAAGGSTGAVGVGQVVSAGRLITLPGCPVNADNLAATLVHLLTFGEFPATDGRGRPLFAYGGLIHNQCERRANFEFGEFVRDWGDEGAQKGWCLYKMGCKGPEAFANCPTQKYAGGASWNVLAGHGCIGCTMPGFWDAMGPAYNRLPATLPFAPDISADQVGLALAGGTAGLAAVHGAGMYVRQWRKRRLSRRPAETPPTEEPPTEIAADEPPEPEMETEAQLTTEPEVLVEPQPAAEPEIVAVAVPDAEETASEAVLPAEASAEAVDVDAKRGETGAKRDETE